MSTPAEQKIGMCEATNDGVPDNPACEPAACGPGCNCGAQARGGSMAKWVVFLVMALAVAGIVTYKALGANRADGGNGVATDQAGFNVPTAMQAEDDKTTSSKAGDSVIGKYLASMAELNTVAIDQDAVFMYVSSAEAVAASDATRTAVASAQKTLGGKNIKVGLYTLKAMSPDHAQIAKQAKLPAVLVACKGGGMGVVSDDVTEHRLLQAFMAASQAGGCGPASAGCGPAGCGPAGCK